MIPLFPKSKESHFNQTFCDEDSARAYYESVRWPDGPVCPHCGELDNAGRLQAKPDSKKPVRKGVWKCYGCREQFSVTVGTIFEDSHLPLHKWFFAIHLLCASKKGMSAHQLHRMLGVSYKSAWFMAHRIRFAMQHPEDALKLKGTVECDETYVGGKRKNQGGIGRPAFGSHKQPVFSLVERGGSVRSFHLPRVTAENLMGVMKSVIEKKTHVVTDDFASYIHVKHVYPMHSVIKHSAKEYSKPGVWGQIHTNTIEGVFAILKRGIIGTYHHVGQGYLQQYLYEFDFRYNHRKTTDTVRALVALKATEGKRLMLREPKIASA